jgi:intein/homing endonuclease
LGYKGDKWDYNAHNKYNTQVVIVDETSMVDMEVFYRLVSAMYSNTRLVFVGDNDQLPSVGPGCVLKELIESKLIKTIFLDTIFRQAECSDIIKQAKKIRDGESDLSLFSDDKTKDIWLIREKIPEKIEKTIINFAQQLKDNPKAKEGKLGFQIITPRNQGPLSVDTLNVALQEALNPPSSDKKEITLNHSVIRKGDRVIIRKNNYELGIFNGDIGKVVFITMDNIVVDLDGFFEEKRRVEIPMRIADEIIKLAYAITVHKCAKGNQKVLSKRGLIPLKDIIKGDAVYTHEGWGNVSWSGFVGKKPVIRVTTKNGYSYETAPEHLYLIANKYGVNFKAAKDLTTDDCAVIPIHIWDTKQQVHTPEIDPCSSRRTKIKVPTELNPDLAWLLGVIIGDGCYTDRVDGTVEIIGPTKLDVLYKVKTLLEEYGLSVCERIKLGKLHSFYVCSKNFRDWLYNLDLDYVTAPYKKIPELIFESNVECRSAFIAGLLDTDGCVDNKAQIRFTTASKDLGHDLQLLLLTLGIITHKYHQGKKHYKVIISGLDYAKFKACAVLHNGKKSQKLEVFDSSATEKTNHHEIPFAAGWVDLFLQEYTKHSGPTKGVKGKGLTNNRKTQTALLNARRGVNKFRLPLLHKMQDIARSEKFELPDIIQKELDNPRYYSRIAKIEELPQEDMYDLTVDGAHSYTINGAFCHNSQGLEYPWVILPFIRAHGNLLLQRNLLYTAITRAKKKVIVLGQASALEYAIQNDKIQKRNTRFSERIKEWITGNGTSMRDMFSNSATCQNAAVLDRLLSLEEKGG